MVSFNGFVVSGISWRVRQVMVIKLSPMGQISDPTASKVLPSPPLVKAKHDHKRGMFKANSICFTLRT